jgi:hypothetical protein
MNVEIGIVEIGIVQFPEKEYIIGIFIVVRAVLDLLQSFQTK